MGSKTASKNRGKEALESLVTQVIEAMENNPSEWTKPWRGTLPTNAVTGRRYHGTNVLLLGLEAAERGFSSGRWATYKQWQSAGCSVRRGESSSVVVFFKQIYVDDKNDPTKKVRIPLLRYSSVFAAEQVDGEHAESLLNVTSTIDADDQAEAFFANVGATVVHGGDSAHFSPSTDVVTLPPQGAFESTESYYSTMAHEFTHWTGGPSRLNRIKHKAFGDSEYAREELVAELGSVFVMNHLGLNHEPDERQAAYLAHWSAHLRRAPKELWSVVGDASAALELLLELTEED